MSAANTFQIKLVGKAASLKRIAHSTLTLSGEAFEAPDYIAPDLRRYFFLAKVISVLGFLTHVFFIIAFLYFSLYNMACINIGSLIFYTFAYYINKRGAPHLSMYLSMAEIILHAIIATRLLGWVANFSGN